MSSDPDHKQSLTTERIDELKQLLQRDKTTVCEMAAELDRMIRSYGPIASAKPRHRRTTPLLRSVPRGLHPVFVLEGDIQSPSFTASVSVNVFDPNEKYDYRSMHYELRDVARIFALNATCITKIQNRLPAEDRVKLNVWREAMSRHDRFANIVTLTWNGVTAFCMDKAIPLVAGRAVLEWIAHNCISVIAHHPPPPA